MKILIRGPEEMKCILQNESKRMGISMNALILVILGDWIEAKRRKQGRDNAFKSKDGEVIYSMERR